MVTKIKDGLFLSDVDASRDPEFIELNKISRIINCAPHAIPNFWSHHGIRYLNIEWNEDGKGILFDQHGELLKQVKSFIDGAHQCGECVLVHCYDGGSRSATLITVYLMYAYWWGLEKAFDFMIAKIPDLTMEKVFIHKLLELDRHLRSQRSKACPSFLTPRVKGWNTEGFEGENEQSIEGIEREDDELILINTFRNSQPLIDEMPRPSLTFEGHKATLLRWIDGSDGHRKGHGSLERPSNASYNSLCSPREPAAAPGKHEPRHKSILKDGRTRNKGGLIQDSEREEIVFDRAQEKQQDARRRGLSAKDTASSSKGEKDYATACPVEKPGFKESKSAWQERSPDRRIQTLNSPPRHQDHHVPRASSSDPLRELQKALSHHLARAHHQRSLSQDSDVSSTTTSSSMSERKSSSSDRSECETSNRNTANKPTANPTIPAEYTRLGTASLYEDLKKSAASSSPVGPPKPFTTTRARPSFSSSSSRPCSGSGKSTSSTTSSHTDTPRPPIMITSPLLTTKALRPSSSSSSSNKPNMPVRAKNVFDVSPQTIKERWNPSPYESFLNKAVKGSPRPKADSSSPLFADFVPSSPAPSSSPAVRTYRHGSPTPHGRRSSDNRSSSAATAASHKDKTSIMTTSTSSPARKLSSATIERLSTPRRQHPDLIPTTPKRPSSPVISSSSTNRSRPSSPMTTRGSSTPTRYSFRPSTTTGQWK